MGTPWWLGGMAPAGRYLIPHVQIPHPASFLLQGFQLRGNVGLLVPIPWNVWEIGHQFFVDGLGSFERRSCLLRLTELALGAAAVQMQMCLKQAPPTIAGFFGDAFLHNKRRFGEEFVRIPW